MSARAEIKAHWPLLIATAWGCGVGVTGLPFYSLSSFVRAFEVEMAWDRGAITASLLTLTIGMMIGGPIVGRLVDRFGARRVALLSIPLFSVGLLLPLLAQGAAWTLWAAYFFMALVGIGTSPITYTRLLMPRFMAARGLALGITLAGTGMAALLMPPFLAAVMGTYGLVGGYVGLALLALSPWFYVLIIARDHDAPTGKAAPERAPSAQPGDINLRHFWTIGLTFFFVSLGLAGVIVHLVPMMLDAGLTARGAAFVASAVGVGVVLARVIIGWLIDHFHAPFVAAVVFVVAGGGCLLLGFGGPGVAIVAAVLIGIAIGAEIDLIAYLVSRYFPPPRYAGIYGWQFGFFAIGAGLSPLLIQAFRSPDGHYALSLSLCAVASVLAAIALLTLGRYRY